MRVSHGLSFLLAFAVGVTARSQCDPMQTPPSVPISPAGMGGFSSAFWDTARCGWIINARPLAGSNSAGISAKPARFATIAPP